MNQKLENDVSFIQPIDTKYPHDLIDHAIQLVDQIDSIYSAGSNKVGLFSEHSTGKSLLAIYYCMKRDFIIKWNLDCQTEERLKLFYAQKLAPELEINPRADTPDYNQLILDMNRKLKLLDSPEKCLFIFDNVKNSLLVEKWISPLFNGTKIKFLTTSKMRVLPENCAIDMTEKRLFYSKLQSNMIPNSEAQYFSQDVVLLLEWLYSLHQEYISVDLLKQILLLNEIEIPDPNAPLDGIWASDCGKFDPTFRKVLDFVNVENVSINLDAYLDILSEMYFVELIKFKNKPYVKLNCFSELKNHTKLGQIQMRVVYLSSKLLDIPILERSFHLITNMDQDYLKFWISLVSCFSGKNSIDRQLNSNPFLIYSLSQLSLKLSLCAQLEWSERLNYFKSFFETSKLLYPHLSSAGLRKHAEELSWIAKYHCSAYPERKLLKDELALVQSCLDETLQIELSNQFLFNKPEHLFACYKNLGIFYFKYANNLKQAQVYLTNAQIASTIVGVEARMEALLLIAMCYDVEKALETIERALNLSEQLKTKNSPILININLVKVFMGFFALKICRECICSI
jgi:hypothetical protein